MKLSKILFEEVPSAKKQVEYPSEKIPPVKKRVMDLLEEIQFETGEQFEIRSIESDEDFEYDISIKIYIPSIEQTVTESFDMFKDELTEKNRIKQKLLKVISNVKRNEEQFLEEGYWERAMQRIADRLKVDVADEVNAEMTNAESSIFGIYFSLRGSWSGVIGVDLKYFKQSGELLLDVWYDEQGNGSKEADLVNDFDGNVNRLSAWVVKEVKEFIRFQGLNRQ